MALQVSKAEYVQTTREKSSMLNTGKAEIKRVSERMIFQLKRYNEACQALDEAVISLKNAKNLERKKKERFMKDIGECKLKVTEGQQQKTAGEKAEDSKQAKVAEQQKEDILTVSKSSLRFPVANESISVRYQKGRGRYVVAQEDIPVGTTLVVEQPVTWALHPDRFLDSSIECELNLWFLSGLEATASIA